MALQKANAIADWRTLIGPTDAHKAKSTHPHRFFLSRFSYHVVFL